MCGWATAAQGVEGLIARKGMAVGAILAVEEDVISKRDHR